MNSKTPLFIHEEKEMKDEAYAKKPLFFYPILL